MGKNNLVLKNKTRKPVFANNTMSGKTLIGSSDSDWLDTLLQKSKLADTCFKVASHKVEFHFHFFIPEILFTMYRSQLLPTIGHSFHLWGTAPKATLNLLDAIQKRAIRLIEKPELTNILSLFSQIITEITNHADQCFSGFFERTSIHCNTHDLSIFQHSYDLNIFKSKINKQLQMRK